VGEHTLGSVGGRGGVEAAAADPSDRHTCAGRKLLDAVEDRRRLELLGHPHVADRAAAGGQQLGDGLAPLDLLAS
jgi:hypothetical protein